MYVCMYVSDSLLALVKFALGSGRINHLRPNHLDFNSPVKFIGEADSVSPWFWGVIYMYILTLNMIFDAKQQ